MVCGQLVGFSMTKFVSAAEIHGRDGLALVAEFATDGEPYLPVLGFLFQGQHAGYRSAGGRTRPAGQCLVALLGIGVAKAMQFGQARPGGVAFVHPQLLHVVSVCWDERTTPRQPMRPVEHLALGLGPDWDLAGLAALGPGVLEHQVVALICVARDELDGLFPAQPERGLQFKTHPHMVVADLGERLSHQGLGLALVADVSSVRNPVMVIRPGDDILTIYFVSAP